MQLEYSELEGNTCVIALSGRLDIIGTGEIETRFAGYCSVNECRVLVDLSGVDFMASIGIRMLVLNAKSVASRSGRVFILNPTENVRHILDISRIPPIIPIFDSLESARAASLIS